MSKSFCQLQQQEQLDKAAGLGSGGQCHGSYCRSDFDFNCYVNLALRAEHSYNILGSY